MIDRYDPHFDQDDRFEMRKVLFPAPTEGVWVRHADHIESVCKYRNKLMEFAASCARCGGTGMQTDYFDEDAQFIPEGDSRRDTGRAITRECDDCDDIRSVLGS